MVELRISEPLSGGGAGGVPEAEVMDAGQVIKKC